MQEAMGVSAHMLILTVPNGAPYHRLDWAISNPHRLEDMRDSI